MLALRFGVRAVITGRPVRSAARQVEESISTPLGA